MNNNKYFSFAFFTTFGIKAAESQTGEINITVDGKNVKINNLGVTKTRSEISESRKEEPKKVEKKEKPMKKKKVKTNKKVVKDTAYYIRFGFVVASAVFVLGCCIFYGTRMIKYYRMFHPKATNGETVTLIKEAILGESPYQTEGEGLYRVGGASVYKGIQVDNYFKYSGLLWRIVSINVDGTIGFDASVPLLISAVVAELISNTPLFILIPFAEFIFITPKLLESAIGIFTSLSFTAKLVLLILTPTNELSIPSIILFILSA